MKRNGIGAGNLVAAGFGKSQPQRNEQTLEGSDRNSRVDLVREP
jgi:outer membrane protein OmpA-like peptidoglycan-associated protein